MKRERVFIFIVVMLVLFASCDMPTLGEEIAGEDGGIGEEIEENSELFVEDKEVSGKYILETNDREYIKENGYTLWTKKTTEAEFAEFTVKVQKVYGNAVSGYGVIFNEGRSGETHSMLSILLNVEGKYAIGKIENGVYKNIEWWKEGYAEGSRNNVIQEGYRAENRIKVAYDKNSEQYSLYINDSKIQDFNDTRDSPLQSGNRGYAVVLSRNEAFPYASVRVEFREVK